MTGSNSFIAGGTWCEVFCQAKDAEFNPIDYEEPRRSLFNLGLSGQRGCLKCRLLYKACVDLFPHLVKDAPLILVRVDDSFGSVNIVLEDTELERIIVDETVYLHYLSTSSPPDWISLPAFRKPLSDRQAQFQPLLTEWLNDCDGNHSTCRREDTPLPTRVIDVGDDNEKEPFLYVSRGNKGRYAALSHCWGKTPFLKTEKHNFSQHQRGIPIQSLPKNFRDAITVSRAIGIQYLWIDSLCIFQDDGPDWEVESSKMASIYQNAQVVLFASNSADSQGGLWNSQWDRDSQLGRTLEIEYRNRDGTTSHIIARKSMSHENIIPGPYLEYEAPSPLATRAWALQEQLLATRSIFFTAKELLWKCPSNQKCECMEEDNNNAPPEDKDFWERAHSTNIAEQFGGWRSLVSHYTKKSITYESDRLPALSGLAKYMQSRGTGQYLAGLWKDDFAESILWLPRPIYPYVAADNTISTYRRRSSPYRAPTWSWLSLETHQGGNSVSRCPEVPDWHENHSWRLAEVHAKLIDAYCEPSGLDPTGAVKSGFIQLEAKCAEVSVTWGNRRSLISRGGLELSVHWDIDLESGLEQTLLCVLIGKAVSGKFRGLVLRQSTIMEGAYERVGLLDDTVDLGLSSEIDLQLDLFCDVTESLVRIV